MNSPHSIGAISTENARVAVDYEVHRNNKFTNGLPWIKVAKNAPYFVTETGEDWTPIGQNDAVTWPDFAALFRRKNIKQVEGHLEWLAAHGVTCLRFMLEYAQTEHRYFERPIGKFSPNMVRLWDDLFMLCNKYKLRLLLTPLDTFWMWIRWKHHPYNQKNGGPCRQRDHFLLCPDTIKAVKNRLAFAAERWGGSGVLFAWDLWNEIHPVYADNRTDVFYDFIQEVSEHLRQVEERLYRRSHLQTVSLYGPVLHDHPHLADVVFCHPALDFANTHLYDEATINHPKDTVAAAVSTGKLMREVLAHVPANRPVFDSEHGPIHTFNDLRITTPEHFDDEYFRYMQWAHFASGAAGGGMRWPYRHPHVLTHGMRQAQRSLADFSTLLDWKNFRRRNMNEEIQVDSATFVAFASGDDRQALLWLLRKDCLKEDGTADPQAEAQAIKATIPGLAAGFYKIIAWETKRGEITVRQDRYASAGNLEITIENITTDLAVAVRRLFEA